MIYRKKYLTLVAAMAGALSVLTSCYYGPQKIAHVRIETASHKVAFVRGATRLSKSEYAGLDTFIKTLPVSAVSYVALQIDDTKPKALLHARQIKKYLVTQGIDRNLIYVQPAPGEASDIVAVYVEYSVAVPPAPCPDWSKSSGGTYNTTNSSNFGCAYYNDLAVQLSDPADFESAKGQDPSIDADRDTGLIQKYRTGGAAGGAGAAPGGGSVASSGAR